MFLKHTTVNGTMQHQPVLLTQAIDGLAIRPDGVYIDGTFGRGGHAMAILKKLSSSGRLLVMDKDPEAIHEAHRLFDHDQRVSIRHESLIRLIDWIKEEDLIGCVNGILLDLGVSSPQLDTPARGFSFLTDGPLDMRMDTTSHLDASTWIAQVEESELTEVLKTYGEERFARRIAQAIVETRKQAPVKTTKQLATLIEKAVPFREKHKHPATRSFQAIRIFINRELEELREGLKDCVDILSTHGRLVVISFHSLEDRIVKRFIKTEEKGEELPRGLPIRYSAFQSRLKHIGRTVRSDKTELKNNPRARSAVLRIAEKMI